MEKQRVHLATESQKNFSSQQSVVAEVFMHAFHFITQIIKKKKVFKDQDLICIASRPFLSKTACRWQRRTQCQCLDSCWGPALLPTIPFALY